MNNTRAEQLSDTVIFQHPTVPTISHADRIIIAMTALVHLIKGMTWGAIEGARRSRVNMQDLQQPSIADRLAPSDSRSSLSNPNPLLPTNAPSIEHLRQSPHLQESSTNKEEMISHEGV